MSFADVVQRLWPGRGQGAPDMKASATAKVIAVTELGRPVWSPRDFRAFAREGFMQNAICYRAVRMVAEAAASIPLLLYERGFEVTEHPLLDLMRKPSLDHTGVDFLESWYGFLLVSGNAYVEAVALGGEVRELHALRPDRMKVIPGSDGWPAGYEYTADGRSVTFEREPLPGVRPILHTRLFHPVDDHYGMSPIEAAATAIDIHNAASGWNKALLDNAARPSGALIYGKGDSQLTAEQFARLKGELEASFQGARNAGRPMLLEGGLDWKPLSLSPKDMDFIEARNAAAREIALALGVPPMLLGIPGDNTYSNYQEASRAFWRQTVLPLVNRACQAFANWLAPAFSPLSAPGRGRGGLELKPDLDQVPALASERDALWTRLEGATFLTANEKRAQAGYDPITGGDELKFAPDRLAAKFNPDQPRVPAGNPGGGQWTNADGSQDAGDGGDGADFTLVTPSTGSGDDGNADGGGEEVPYGTTPDGTPVDPAQARRPGWTVNIGRQQFTVTSARQEELFQAGARAEMALNRVRELDPDWRPAPSLSDPTTADGAINAFRATAQQAEARLLVLERDNLPLGFGTHAAFAAFGRSLRTGLNEAGYGDAQPYLRGSAVTGYGYRDGRPFGSESDLDFAIASPTMMQRARELGIPLRGGGVRTRPLTENDLSRLGLNSMANELAGRVKHPSTFMIYESEADVVGRPPFVSVP